VIGGCLEEEFKESSLRLMAEFQEGLKRMVLSELTLRELSHAPPDVRQIVENIPIENREVLTVTNEALFLANAYLREGIVTPATMADGLHIATATAARVDVLVSWNFRHIVNLNRIRLYNSVNLKEGYGLIDIRVPREVLDEKNF
jgi:hypothetical protein